MPVRGRDKVDEESRQSWFSHQSEEARPYYYSVYLADHDIKAEIAPTERAAIMRFTFPESDESGVVIDAFDRGSYIRVMHDKRTVVGYTTRNSGGVPDNFKNWFIVRFDRKIRDFQIYDGTKPVEGEQLVGEHALVRVGFETRRGEQVTVRAASSFISQMQAVQNLEELGKDDFETVKAKAQARWDEVLGRIEVEGGTTDQYRTFYSCLYRSTLFPRKFYEIDKNGNILHYSPYNGEVLPGYMYTDTGFWDTFRSLFPLLNLVYPSVNAEIQAGLANAYRESGFLPEWASPGHRGCMVGNNSASVVSDAILKGVTPEEDIATLYEAMLAGRRKVHPTVSSTGRLGHEYYNTLGYIPYDVGINENAARTLEYAYDDWCIYQLGLSLGKSKKELAPFAKRALNYRNLFDPAHKLMRGKNEDGTFQSPFNPLKWGDAFTEGNSWHYSWSVFHDPQGLIDLMGGKDSFNRMMDSVFVLPPVFDESYYGSVIHEIREMQIMNMGNYAHGNQPIQHMIYLYNYSSQPWKAQYWLREVMERMYNANPDGYCGDEDNGQTSAWYVFSALGFYPVCPGTDQYVLGAPLFRSVRLHLENGKTVTIEAPENSRANRYVQKLTVDGVDYTRNYLTHGQLMNGSSLRFTMDNVPNKQRGAGEEDAPYSFSKTLKKKK